MFPKIRELSKNVTVYGLGDIIVSIVNFLLLGVYVKYFTAEDYGIIGILGAMEVIAKIVFRFGLDGSFMRFFYDCKNDDSRRRMASTIFFFLLALNGVVVAALMLAAPWLAEAFAGNRAATTALRLMLLNTAGMMDAGLDARDWISMVKVQASETLGRVTDRAVQVFGGMGFCKELPIERYYRDARVYRIFDGTSEIHRGVIARNALKRGAALFDVHR